jgi:putative chitinase
MSILAQIQKHVGVNPDGKWGPNTATAIAQALGLFSATKPAEPASMETGGPIDDIDAALLRVAMPSLSIAQLEPWVAPIRAACVRFDIDNIRRIAAFLTTQAHEGGFKVGVREGMNYSAQRMAEVWPSRFSVSGRRGGKPNGLALALHRKPEEIANHVYANRMGNGPPESGDGWRYRGNGPSQLTGKENHERFAKAMGMTVEKATTWIGTIEGGVMSAAWFWEDNDINRLADTSGVEDETRKINGGLIGVEERRAIFDRLVAEMLRRDKVQ